MGGNSIGQEADFLFHYLIRGPIMKISALQVNITPLACGGKKKKLASRSIVAGSELPHEYS